MDFVAALPAGSAIVTTLQLAGLTTVLLVALTMPLAWWLATTSSRFKPFVETLTALPLVLPATVLGFYLLLVMNPDAPLGRFWVFVTGESLSFSFSGLVVASLLYSLPFAVQPMQGAFEAVGLKQREAAQMLGASAWDTFFSVVLPLSRRGVLTACVLVFAHTMGEFGTVLMVGGAIPGQTETVSIAVYNRVETLQYAEAHMLSAMLLAFSFLVLLIVYSTNRGGLFAPGRRDVS